MSEPLRDAPDPRPLPELFRENADGLTGAVRGILGPEGDVREVLQQAFLKAWQAEARDGPARDRVPWLFVVTLNLARDVRRAATRRACALPVEELDPAEVDSMRGSPLNALTHKEWRDAARAAIHRLQEPEKEVFLLRVSAGVSFPAIAASLGIPEGTAKTRMRTALGKLRRHLHGFAPEAASLPPSRDPS